MQTVCRCRLSIVVMSAVFLLTFMPLIAASMSTSTCEPPFGDVASRSLISSLVFEGRPASVEHGHGGTSNATFSVSRVLKGSANSQRVLVTVGCSFEVDIGALYVVFAVNASTNQGDGGSTPVYGILGEPVPSSRRVLRQVNAYACAECAGQ